MFAKYVVLPVVLGTLGICGCSSAPQKPHLSPRPPVTQAPPAERLRPADPNGIITLPQALDLALARSPLLSAQALQLDIAEAHRIQAALHPNPKLELEVEEFGGAGERSEFNAAEAAIQLSQRVETAGKRNKRVALAQRGNDLAGWDYQSARLDLLTQTSKAFVDVLAAQERSAATSELLALAQELSAMVAKRVEVGNDSPLEATKAAIALSDIRLQHRQAVQDLDLARRRLAANWADSAATFTTAAGTLHELAPPPTWPELTDSLAQNPDYARWQAEIAQREAAVDLEEARAVGDITVRGGMKRSNETDDNYFVVGIALPLPLLDRNQGARQAASHKLAQARHLQAAASNTIATQLLDAYRTLTAAYNEAFELDRNVLTGAQTVLDAAETAYRQGKLDYLSVLDAQRTLFQARQRRIEAAAAYHLARVDVERLTGRISYNENHLQP